MDSKNKNKQASPSHICEMEDGGSHATSDHQKEKKKKKRFCSACVCFEFDVAPFAFLMILLILISAFVTRGDQWSLFPWSMNKGVEEVGISTFSNVPSKDKLLGGLLSEEFDEESCKSRYESMFFTNASSTDHKPSPYLIERLRKYEELHKRCGPNTELYNKSIDQLLKSGKNSDDQQSECKYLINQPNSGLGNRMITLASSFLYALLSNRVLLTESGKDISELFCEPFPQSSWLLSPDFPLNQLHPLRFGNIVQDSTRNSSSTIPSYAFFDLSHASNHYDKLFFCDEVQHDLVNNITWIITASNQYFLPAFFLMPSYREELNLLFPEKDTVFHHLGRYLFHPSNSVWGLITRYYSSYLANAEQRLGIQIRVFNPKNNMFLKEKPPPELVLDQIISCALKEKLLPNVTLSVKKTSNDQFRTRRRSKSVLITSLKSDYFESIKNMYWEKPSVDGEIISVYQPSHEEYQQTEKSSHDMKALAEIYLLSYSNVLVTSALSTFGYVAQSLGGMKPWILTRPDHYKNLPEIPCTRALSMEPCYHAPGTYDCRAKKDLDFGLVVDHVKHCEDVSEGLKLIGEDA